MPDATRGEGITPNTTSGPFRALRAGVSLSVCLFVLAFFGCGSSEDKDTSTGEWTIEQGALTLEEDLHVSDNEDFYFGDINDVAVGKEGKIYVADGEEHHVKVLSPKGGLVKTIGAQGEGPGEFERPTEVVLARGDSLYVLDGYYGRLSAFGPNHNFAYRASFRANRAHPSRISPIPGESGYLARYGYIGPLSDGRKDRAVRRVSAKGSVGDTLFTFPPPVVHMENSDGRYTFRQIPYARGPYTAGDSKGNVHYGWSDSLGVKAYSPDGELLHTIDIPFEPVPVTEEDRKQALEGRSKESRAAVESKIPETKPAFDHFLVDDEGRYWFGRPTSHPDSMAWWVAEPDEKRVVTGKLPSKVKFLEVKGSSAYGKTTTEEGAPALVRYRMESSQQTM